MQTLFTNTTHDMGAADVNTSTKISTTTFMSCEGKTTEGSDEEDALQKATLSNKKSVWHV